MSKFKQLVIIASLIGSAQLSASNFSYNYIDLKVGNIEVDDSDTEGDYTSFSGGYEIEGKVYATLEISNTEYDSSSSETDYLKFGVGMHTPMGSAADLYGTFQVVEAEVNSSEDVGNQIDLGVRIALSKSLEFHGKLMRLKFDEDPYTGYTTAARFYVNPQMAFGGGIEFWERDGYSDFEIMYVNARFNF